MSLQENSNNATFGMRLKEARIRFGMTQQQMANFLAISLQSVSRYERGIVQPQISELAPLVGKGVDLNWLVTGTGRMLRDSDAADTPLPSVAPSIDRTRMRAVISALFDMIKSGSEILEYPPDVLADWMVQGYEWLGTMSPEEKKRTIARSINDEDQFLKGGK